MAATESQLLANIFGIMGQVKIITLLKIGTGGKNNNINQQEDRMSVVFTNAELVSRETSLALSLFGAKSLPVKSMWTVSDFIEFVRTNAKKYSELKKKIFTDAGVVPDKDGNLSSDLPEVKQAVEELDALEIEVPITPFALPETDAGGKPIFYEPVIGVALKKIFVR